MWCRGSCRIQFGFGDSLGLLLSCIDHLLSVSRTTAGTTDPLATPRPLYLSELMIRKTGATLEPLPNFNCKAKNSRIFSTGSRGWLGAILDS